MDCFALVRALFSLGNVTRLHKGLTKCPATL
jgi:hypothetical protein